MRNLLCAALLFGMAAVSLADDPVKSSVGRDRFGRVVWTATTNGNRTTYRDHIGRTQAIETRFGNRSTIFDNRGRVVYRVQHTYRNPR